MKPLAPSPSLYEGLTAQEIAQAPRQALAPAPRSLLGKRGETRESFSAQLSDIQSRLGKAQSLAVRGDVASAQEEVNAVESFIDSNYDALYNFANSTSVRSEEGRNTQAMVAGLLRGDFMREEVSELSDGSRLSLSALLDPAANPNAETFAKNKANRTLNNPILEVLSLNTDPSLSRTSAVYITQATTPDGKQFVADLVARRNAGEFGVLTDEAMAALATECLRPLATGDGKPLHLSASAMETRLKTLTGLANGDYSAANLSKVADKWYTNKARYIGDSGVDDGTADDLFLAAASLSQDLFGDGTETPPEDLLSLLAQDSDFISEYKGIMHRSLLAGKSEAAAQEAIKHLIATHLVETYDHYAGNSQLAAMAESQLARGMASTWRVVNTFDTVRAALNSFVSGTEKDPNAGLAGLAPEAADAVTLLHGVLPAILDAAGSVAVDKGRFNSFENLDAALTRLEREDAIEDIAETASISARLPKDVCKILAKDFITYAKEVGVRAGDMQSPEFFAGFYKRATTLETTEAFKQAQRAQATYDLVTASLAQGRTDAFSSKQLTEYTQDQDALSGVSTALSEMTDETGSSYTKHGEEFYKARATTLYDVFGDVEALEAAQTKFSTDLNARLQSSGALDKWYAAVDAKDQEAKDAARAQLLDQLLPGQGSATPQMTLSLGTAARLDSTGSEPTLATILEQTIPDENQRRLWAHSFIERFVSRDPDEQARAKTSLQLLQQGYLASTTVMSPKTIDAYAKATDAAFRRDVLDFRYTIDNRIKEGQTPPGVDAPAVKDKLLGQLEQIRRWEANRISKAKSPADQRQGHETVNVSLLTALGDGAPASMAVLQHVLIGAMTHGDEGMRNTAREAAVNFTRLMYGEEAARQAADQMSMVGRSQQLFAEYTNAVNKANKRHGVTAEASRDFQAYAAYTTAAIDVLSFSAAGLAKGAAKKGLLFATKPIAGQSIPLYTAGAVAGGALGGAAVAMPNGPSLPGTYPGNAGAGAIGLFAPGADYFSQAGATQKTEDTAANASYGWGSGAAEVLSQTLTGATAGAAIGSIFFSGPALATGAVVGLVTGITTVLYDVFTAKADTKWVDEQLQQDILRSTQGMFDELMDDKSPLSDDAKSLLAQAKSKYVNAKADVQTQGQGYLKALQAFAATMDHQSRMSQVNAMNNLGGSFASRDANVRQQLINLRLQASGQTASDYMESGMRKNVEELSTLRSALLSRQQGRLSPGDQTVLQSVVNEVAAQAGYGVGKSGSSEIYNKYAYDELLREALRYQSLRAAGTPNMLPTLHDHLRVIAKEQVIPTVRDAFLAAVQNYTKVTTRAQAEETEEQREAEFRWKLKEVEATEAIKYKFQSKRDEDRLRRE